MIICGFVSILTSVFLCVYAPMCLSMGDVLCAMLSLTFVYIISIASAELWSFMETCPRVAQSASEIFEYFQILCIWILERVLERWTALMEYINLFLFFLRTGNMTRHTPPKFPNWTHTFSKFSPELMTPCVQATVCVYRMLISLLHSPSVHLCVCNSTKRCSQGGISSAFLSVTCFISKDELSQAVRQTQSDKTAEQMGSVWRDVSGDRWWF